MRIRVATERPRQEREVDVMPGMRASEVLEKAGLTPGNYVLLKPDNTEFMESEEVLPFVSSEGIKLHAEMKSSVGAITDSVDQWMERLFASLSSLFKKSPVYIIKNQSDSVRTMAQDSGWVSSSKANGTIIHKGNYIWGRRRWRGEVEQQGGTFHFFIWNPPIELIRMTEYAGCFHLESVREAKYRISWKVGQYPKSLSSGIISVNRVLNEAMSLRRR